jgi:hypothetical protein
MKAWYVEFESAFNYVFIDKAGRATPRLVARRAMEDLIAEQAVDPDGMTVRVVNIPDILNNRTFHVDFARPLPHMIQGMEVHTFILDERGVPRNVKAGRV